MINANREWMIAFIHAMRNFGELYTLVPFWFFILGILSLFGFQLGLVGGIPNSCVACSSRAALDKFIVIYLLRF